MKKRLLACLLGMAMVISMIGCGSSNGAESTEPAAESAPAAENAPTAEEESAAEDTAAVSEETVSGEKKKINIGMAWAILDDGQTNLTNVIKESFENDYPDYEIEYTLTNADSDISKLISDVESLLAKNPDMIFIMNSVGDEGIIPAIDTCIEAGVPVGIGVEVAGANYTYLYEGFSQYACGQMQAEYMESIYDETAEYNVACITGNAGNTAGQERTAGFKENFVDKHDNVNVVIEGEGNWNTDDSQALTEDWLIAHPEINLIACVNDDEAQGAINACKAAGREDIIILGMDGSDVGRGNVESGAQAASVLIDFVKVGQASAKAMIDCAEGNLTSNKVAYTTENLGLVIKE